MVFNSQELISGIVDTIVGVVTFRIFSMVISDYPQWTTVTPGEIAILVAVTGLGAIFGMRILAYGLPKILTQLLELYATTEHGKHFLERFQKNEVPQS